MKTDTVVPQELLWFFARSLPWSLKSNLRIWKSPEARQQLSSQAVFQDFFFFPGEIKLRWGPGTEKHKHAPRILIKDTNDWCLPWRRVCFEVTTQTFPCNLQLQPALRSSDPELWGCTEWGDTPWILARFPYYGIAKFNWSEWNNMP